jgi:hypothetical protein
MCLHSPGKAATNRQSKPEQNKLLGSGNSVAMGASGQSSPWDLLMLEPGAAMPKSIDHQMICFLALWLLEHGPWPTCGTKV